MTVPSWLLALCRALVGRVSPPVVTPASPVEGRRGKISPEAVAQLRARPPVVQLTPITPHPTSENPFVPAKPPAGLKKAIGADVEMALDEAWFPELNSGFGSFPEGIGFFGYPLLAEMAQRPEYRKMVEVLATDMTREWIRFTYSGDEDKSERIRQIEAAFDRLKVRDHFRRAIELDGFFGRSHVYLDLGTTDHPAELETALVLDPAKITKGSLKRLQVVEPTWTYPANYNSTDPLKADYYRPVHWYVMAKKVHETRLLTFVLRPVPDILKPAYMFGGLSLTQMAKPYVDNWLRNRQSTSDLLEAFTVWVLKTDMSGFLNGTDADSLSLRLDTFNILRDNRGVMALNKGDGGTDDGEEFSNVTTPLSGLNELLSSSQEQLCFVAGEPLVKLLGTTPSGLNASSDGEVRVYYDTVHACQDRLMLSPLMTVLKVVQLSEFGEIDEDIGIEFKPLWQLDEVQRANARKTDADADCAYVNASVLDPVEIRKKLAGDKTGPFATIDVDAAPEPPAQPGDDFGGGEEDEQGPSSGRDRPKNANDAAPIVNSYELHGLRVMVETPRGGVRVGGHGSRSWRATVAADYGFVAGTWSTEGRGEEMDCFVGSARDSQKVFIIDQLDLETGQFDEHKCMLGYDNSDQAVEDYVASYSDRARDRIMAVTPTTVAKFKTWLRTGDLYRPFSRSVGP